MYALIKCLAVTLRTFFGSLKCAPSVVASALALVVAASSAFGQTAIVHVDAASQAQNPDGSTWALAYLRLQDGLAEASDLIDNELADEVHIYVATGTYYADPAGGTPFGGNPALSFHMANNVRIYGHFAGTESDPDERELDNSAYETILSGDLKNDDTSAPQYDSQTDEFLGITWGNYSDNSHHVVRADGVNRSAHLDGFTITGGICQTFGQSPGTFGGGGLRAIGSTPTVRNCTFRLNRTRETGFGSAYGGAVYLHSGTADPDPASRAWFENCLFEHNLGTKGGGAVYVAEFSPVVFIRCRVIENEADNKSGGGGLWVRAHGDMVNCEVRGNLTSSEPGAAGLYAQFGNVNLWNCLFAKNKVLTSTTSPGAISLDLGAVNAEIINCTIADNESGDATGGHWLKRFDPEPRGEGTGA